MDLLNLLIYIYPYRYTKEVKENGDYTYTYNPCYQYSVGENGCTNVAVSHITISYCMHVAS